MRHILICDDDAEKREQLRGLVGRLMGAGVSVTACDSVDRLERTLEKAPPPDVVLMDIELGQNLCGIDVVKRLFPAGAGVQVIYITGYVEYCTRVYETEHISFLVKPVREEELRTALDRALDRAADGSRARIVVHAGAQLRFLPFSELRYLESAGRKIKFHWGGQTCESYARLKDTVRELDDRFYQCHKSFVVNLDYVASCDGRDYALATGERVPISGRCRVEAKSAFLHRLSHTAFDAIK